MTEQEEIEQRWKQVADLWHDVQTLIYSDCGHGPCKIDELFGAIGENCLQEAMKLSTNVVITK